MQRNKMAETVDLANLRSMSCRLGRNPTLVQGSGGNTSVKDGNIIWVKASGTWLAHAEKQNIMVPVDLTAIQQMIRSGKTNFNDARLHGTLHPSIETSLHCLFDHHVVVHVHSVNAIAWSVQIGAKKHLREILKQIDWRYIPYAKPGVSLATKVANTLDRKTTKPSLLILENHGLVIGGETCDAVESLLTNIELKLQIPERLTNKPNIRLLKSAIKNLPGWRLPVTADIHKIALDKDSINIVTTGALIPDHAVFLQNKVPVCESPDEISQTIGQYHSTFGVIPDWIIVPDAGVILSEKMGAAAESQLLGLAMITLRIPPGSNVRFIGEHAAKDLRAWDAEKYRVELDAELSKTKY